MINRENLQEVQPQIEDSLQAINVAAQVLAQRYPGEVARSYENPLTNELIFGDGDDLGVRISYAEGSRPSAVRMSIATDVSDWGGPRNFRMLTLEEGVVYDATNPCTERPMYETGTGFLKGIGPKRAAVTAGRLAVMRQALEARLAR